MLAGMGMHPISRLRDLGQSIWLDFIERALFASGEIDRLIERDGLTGVTSNPTIFQKAIASSSDYDAFILGAAGDEPDRAVYERLEVADVAMACDRFAPVYERTAGADGFVSIEVSPSLAHDADGEVQEARRLWKSVSRPNLMVKIPGTREGVAAIERCLAEGINVNITLLFSVTRYADVAQAYLRALEARVGRGEPVGRLASVASFFVSRVDAKVDATLDARAASGGGSRVVERGRTAIANAKLAYELYERDFVGHRWERLAREGARPQRLLWASTSPKDPKYGPLYYAEALVGRNTVDTVTPETLREYIGHGNPEERLTRGREEARGHMRRLAELGVDFERTAQELEDEGVEAFGASIDKTMALIAEKRRVRRSA